MVRSHLKITRKKPARIESVAKRKCSAYNSWHENKCYIPRTIEHATDIPALTDFSFGRLRSGHCIIKGADLIQKYEASASWKHTLGKSYYTNRSIVPELNYFYDPTRVELNGDRARKAVRRRGCDTFCKPPTKGLTTCPYTLCLTDPMPPPTTFLPAHSMPVWVYSIMSVYARTDIRRFGVIDAYKKSEDAFRNRGQPAITTVDPPKFFHAMLSEYTDAILKEQRLHNAVGRLKYAYKRRKALANPLNDVDPFTLESPKHPIVCVQGGGHYIFEAYAIRNHFTALLNTVEYGFPSPQVPRNPLTNTKFHVGQIHCIRNQLVALGYTNSTIEGYRECNYNIAVYKQLHYKKIQVANLDHTVSNKNELKNFFKYQVFPQMAYEFPHNEYVRIRKILWWAVDHVRSDYMELWKRHYRNYEMYGILYSEDSRELANLLDHEKYMMGRLYRNKMVVDEMDKLMRAPRKYVWNRRESPMVRAKRRMAVRQLVRRVKEAEAAAAARAAVT